MVCERAEVTIFTGLNIFWEISAEFSLVFFNMIQSFNSVMGQDALVFIRTSISFGKVANVCGVIDVLSPLVFNGVVVLAVFMVVLITQMTLFRFKFTQV